MIGMLLERLFKDLQEETRKKDSKDGIVLNQTRPDR